VAHLVTKERYELCAGHPIYCAPTGGDGARGQFSGAHVLDTDPEVESAGGDAGFALGPHKLRAPDIAVGNVPDQAGWIKGAPPLAVEYASAGQDEAKLQEKIADFLAAGTQWVWVVRLLGPRRVEIYQHGQPVRTFGPGEMLSAPGILRNAVPVQALYDRSVAHELTLRNLLQRKGYGGLDEVREQARKEGQEQGWEAGREQGWEQGRIEALRRAVGEVVEARGLVLDGSQAAVIAQCQDLLSLERWLRTAAIAETTAALFDLPATLAP
jgi:Uma2 family endonuclease